MIDHIQQLLRIARHDMSWAHHLQNTAAIKCNTHIMLCNVSLHHPEACLEDGYLQFRWQLQ